MVRQPVSVRVPVQGLACIPEILILPPINETVAVRILEITENLNALSCALRQTPYAVPSLKFERKGAAGAARLRRHEEKPQTVAVAPRTRPRDIHRIRRARITAYEPGRGDAVVAAPRIRYLGRHEDRLRLGHPLRIGRRRDGRRRGVRRYGDGEIAVRQSESGFAAHPARVQQLHHPDSIAGAEIDGAGIRHRVGVVRRRRRAPAHGHGRLALGLSRERIPDFRRHARVHGLRKHNSDF